MKTGSCLCGSVAFEIHGALTEVVACHCRQCRKQTGNYWSSTTSADVDLKFTRQDGLRWFAASDFAKRGFCSNCGSTLFWKKNDSSETSICAGSIDGATGFKLGGHIFTADAGDYCVIAGGDYRT